MITRSSDILTLISGYIYPPPCWDELADHGSCALGFLRPVRFSAQHHRTKSNHNEPIHAKTRTPALRLPTSAFVPRPSDFSTRTLSTHAAPCPPGVIERMDWATWTARRGDKVRDKVGDKGSAGQTIPAKSIGTQTKARSRRCPQPEC